MVIQPLRDGVIANFQMTETMLAYFIRKALKRKPFLSLAPKAIVCVPVNITDVEKRAVEEATHKAGIREVYIAEEPLAAGIGAGLPVGEASGCMIVDFGGGTTEVAVIACGGTVIFRSIRLGGNKMDETIISYVKRVYNVLIGERSAEELKINLGSLTDYKYNNSMDIKGRHLTSGLPVTIRVMAHDIRKAMRDNLENIIELIKLTLGSTPPEISSDIMKRGIILTGGGSLLPGLDILVQEETGIPVMVADNPMDCVSTGAGKMLEYLDELLKKHR
jgi:rod shape-determining protein MreB